MIEIERPNITTAELSEDGKHGTFVIEPLERGYGITLGNSLRRVLLSSLPGVAVTNIKIDGVLHEMQTVKGVKEDVTEIVLNVKQIVARLFSQTPKTVIIKEMGCTEVTAGCIKAAPAGHTTGEKFPEGVCVAGRFPHARSGTRRHGAFSPPGLVFAQKRLAYRRGLWYHFVVE